MERSRVVGALVLWACLAASWGTVCHAAEEEDGGKVVSEEGERIELALPEIPGLRRNGSGGSLKREWELRTERQKIWIWVHAYPPSYLAPLDPADVASFETMVLSPFDPALSCDGIQVLEYVKGVKGGQAAGAVAGGGVTHPTYGAGEFLLFAGVLPRLAFDVVIVRFGDADPALRAALLQFLRTGVRASTLPFDPTWSEPGQAQAWVERVLPPGIDPTPFKVALRTKHFVLISDTKVPKSAEAALEATYELVRKIAPFEEAPGGSLTAGLLFRTRAQYTAFCDQTSADPVLVRRSAGHSRPEGFAMHAEAWNEALLRHEAAHQLLRNRARLDGGGSWLQEGLAEYVSTRAEDRKRFAKAAATSGRFTPFREFVRTEMLLGVGTEEAARSAYLQAACMIEFLRDGAFQPKQFPAFLRTAGRIPWGRPDDVLAAFKTVYGVDIDAIEKAWVQHASH